MVRLLYQPEYVIVGKRMINIFVIEELKYFIAHYTTVTNSDHACAAFPIIDYKQLHWR